MSDENIIEIELSEEEIAAEKVRRNKLFDELQIFLHNSLTKVISQALDADPLYDPFTVINFMGQILKVYYEKCQEEFDKKISEKTAEMEKVKGI